METSEFLKSKFVLKPLNSPESAFLYPFSINSSNPGSKGIPSIGRT